MSEVYRNSTQYVNLDIYGDVADTPPTAVISYGTTSAPLTVQGPATIVGNGQRWTAIVDFAHTSAPRELTVTWHFTINGVNAVKADFLEVIVPLVEVGTAREELEIPADITDDKIRLAERRVRMLIERITGQSFAPEEAILPATQLSDGSVRLPKRLISLTGVGGAQNALYYTLGGDGWFLNILYPNKRTGIRASDVPIADPFARYRSPKVEKVSVSGLWGYERVPTDVQEAALILIEQQLCPESIYAERYLKTMTAADFRFEFDPGAYRGTGNVIADQLLARYTTRNAAVI